MAALRQEERRAGSKPIDDGPLAFDIEQAADGGWQVQVWPFNRDAQTGRAVFTIGAFFVVRISHDWQVTAITGSA